MTQLLVEYFANSLWQVPLLAVAALFLIRMVRPHVRVEHGLWLAVLMLAVLLPLRGLAPAGTEATPQIAAESVSGIARPLVQMKEGGSLMRSPVAAGEHAVAGTRPMGKPPSHVFAGLLRVRRVHLSSAGSRWVAMLYLATIGLGVLRLACAYIAARRLVRQGWHADLSSDTTVMLERCCRYYGVRPPRILFSEDAPGPMIAGVLRPVLLLPADLEEYSGDEVEAVLSHELGHVRRRDYLVNLICQISALPIFYHPATGVLHRGLRQTREMLCDDLAAERMHSARRYSDSLMSLAQRMVQSYVAQGVQGVGLFNNKNRLEERIMRLRESVEGGEAVSSEMIGAKGKTAGAERSGCSNLSAWRLRSAVRLMGGGAVMAGVLAAAALFHVTTTFARSRDVSDAGIVTKGRAAARTAARDADSPGFSTAQPASAPAPARAMAAADGMSRALLEGAPQLGPAPPGASDLAPAPAINGESGAPHSADDRQGKHLDVVVPLAGEEEGGDGQATAIIDEQYRSSEDWRLLQKIFETLNAKLAAEGGTFHNPEFQRQMADTLRSLNEATARADVGEALRAVDDPATRKRMEEAGKIMNSPEFKERMEDAQKAVDPARMKKSMEDAERMFNSPEFKQQMDDARRQIDNPEFKQRMAEAERQVAAVTARMNNPEFKAQMAARSKAWKDEGVIRELRDTMGLVDNPEFERHMEDARRLASEAKAAAGTAELKRQMGELQREIDAASRAARESADQLRDLPSK
ncbi:MAG TPA: M56 family metallopeptidase [Acidisarcina sp.]